jgi:hypothetical protein
MVSASMSRAWAGKPISKANLVNPTMAGDTIDQRLQIRVPLKAGPHVITAALVERMAALNPARLQPFVRSSIDTRDTSGHPHFDALTIMGPFKATGPGDTPSRRRIFICGPVTPAQEEPCARKIVANLARRAYRGAATDADMRRLIGFYETGRIKGTRTPIGRLYARSCGNRPVRGIVFRLWCWASVPVPSAEPEPPQSHVAADDRFELREMHVRRVGSGILHTKFASSFVRPRLAVQ